MGCLEASFLRVGGLSVSAGRVGGITASFVRAGALLASFGLVCATDIGGEPLLLLGPGPGRYIVTPSGNAIKITDIDA